MVDQEKIRTAVRMILEAIGEDPDRDGLKDTPDRVAQMYADIFRGLHEDIGKPLEVIFDEGHDEMVLVPTSPFTPCASTISCPLWASPTSPGHSRQRQGDRPFQAGACRRGSGPPPADAGADDGGGGRHVDGAPPAKGVAVVIEAEHLCMSMRGIQKPGHKTITSAVRGAFTPDEKTRLEAFSLMGHRLLSALTRLATP